MKLHVTPSRAGRGTPRAVPLRQASATLTPISESVLHSQIVQFCWAQLPTDAIFHHSPNEGKRGWNAQRWLKHSGAKAGWPDLEIFWNGRVLFLEVKSKKGDASKAQFAVHDQLIRAGFPPVVVRSLEEAERVIKAWIKFAS